MGLIHEDSAFLVLDKPAGLLSVPGRGADKQDCLSARVQRLYPDALVVHRLDQATSGLLVMARGLDNQRRLSAAFASRAVYKRYVAVVHGCLAPMQSRVSHIQHHEAWPDETWQLIDLPLIADWPNRPRQKIDLEHGKPSQTRWRIARLPNDPWTVSGNTRLELEPLTGRTHQLRVHLAAIGHPILGDRLYAPLAVQVGSDRLLLHACALEFAHPQTGRGLCFTSECPF